MRESEERRHGRPQVHLSGESSGASADTDTDTGADTHSNADASAGTNANSDAASDADANSDAETEPDADTDPGTSANANADSGTDARTYTDSGSYAVGDTNSDTAEWSDLACNESDRGVRWHRDGYFNAAVAGFEYEFSSDTTWFCTGESPLPGHAYWLTQRSGHRRHDVLRLVQHNANNARFG
jgi:hypothetical protein